MSDKPFTVRKVGYSMFIPHDYFKEPTAEESAQWEARRLAKDNHIRVGIASAPESLRPIIELHSNKHDECQGCDGAGDWNPEWPCRTIQLIADTYDNGAKP